MRVNGRDHPYREGLTLRALLDELQVNPQAVAVMHGDEIHHAGRIPDAPVAEQDTIEIITMMPGG